MAFGKPGRPPSEKTLVDRYLNRNRANANFPQIDNYAIPNHSGTENYEPLLDKVQELIDASVPSINYIKQMLLFGDATDGDVTIGVGTTTLTNTAWYDDLVVNGTLSVAGFKVFANTVTVNNGGIIQRAANNGGNGNGVGAGGSAGAALSASENGGSGAGQAGGANGANGVNGGNSIPSWGGTGGHGGDSASFTGGSGGTATLRTRRDLISIITGLYGTSIMNGGSGGGSGAGSALIDTQGGGGSGSGGGICWICAKTITINNGGIIRALGGNGGNSGGAQSGVGAGGGGGCVVLIYETLVNNGTISVAGGSNGSTGLTTNATSATAGKIIMVDLTAGTVTVT